MSRQRLVEQRAGEATVQDDKFVSAGDTRATEPCPQIADRDTRAWFLRVGIAGCEESLLQPMTREEEQYRVVEPGIPVRQPPLEGIPDRRERRPLIRLVAAQKPPRPQRVLRRRPGGGGNRQRTAPRRASFVRQELAGSCSDRPRGEEMAPVQPELESAFTPPEIYGLLGTRRRDWTPGG